MSSLKDDVDKTQSSWPDRPSNPAARKTSATYPSPDVSHVEMWPYVASAAARSSAQARTAVRISPRPGSTSRVVARLRGGRRRPRDRVLYPPGALGVSVCRRPRRSPRTDGGIRVAAAPM